MIRGPLQGSVARRHAAVQICVQHLLLTEGFWNGRCRRVLAGLLDLRS